MKTFFRIIFAIPLTFLWLAAFPIALIGLIIDFFILAGNRSIAMCGGHASNVDPEKVYTENENNTLFLVNAPEMANALISAVEMIEKEKAAKGIFVKEWSKEENNCIILQQENAELRRCLEIDCSYDDNGNKIPFIEGMPNGIVCRDATIKVLEEQNAELKAQNAYYIKEVNRLQSQVIENTNSNIEVLNKLYQHIDELKAKLARLEDVEGLTVCIAEQLCLQSRGMVTIDRADELAQAIINYVNNGGGV